MARRKRKRKTHMPPKTKRSRVKLLIFAIAIIFCLIFEVSCRVPVPVDESGYDNLTLGIPGPADTIIDRPGYALGYDELHEQAAWVICRLTAEELRTKVSSRSDDFRADPDIPTGSAMPADYKKSGFDRGHMAPAADMAHSARTMSDSFYMSNICPQRPECNRKIWKNLENQVRKFALAEQDVYIVAGPIFLKTPLRTIGANKVAVPDAFYKIIYDQTPPQKMLAFIVPNDGSSAPLQSFVVTGGRVEEITRLDFFPLLPQSLQEELESSIDVNAWDW